MTALSMLAFAGNSLLGRAALLRTEMGPAQFTLIRLGAGALVLAVVVRARKGAAPAGSWASALCLILYAVPFALAYVSLGTGTGALILFGLVQVTMIGYGIGSGERPSPRVWLGILSALVGLVYLVLPGLSAPDPLGAGLMALAGVGWGVYSLRGRRAVAPVAETAGNFLRAVPVALGLAVIEFTILELRALPWDGILLALLSGALTSGLGYTLWYATLPHLTSTTSGVVQLTVPVLAAALGALLLAEPVTLRLGVASGLILGGVAVATLRGAGSRSNE